MFGITVALVAIMLIGAYYWNLIRPFRQKSDDGKLPPCNACPGCKAAGCGDCSHRPETLYGIDNTSNDVESP